MPVSFVGISLSLAFFSQFLFWTLSPCVPWKRPHYHPSQGKSERSHQISPSAEQPLALCFFPPFFSRSGKKVSAAPQGGMGKCWGMDIGSWFTGSWLTTEAGPDPKTDLPLSLLDWAGFNCLFYLSFCACLPPASLWWAWGIKRKWEQWGIVSTFLPNLSLFTSPLYNFWF